jgi:hypothetical protein
MDALKAKRKSQRVSVTAISKNIEEELAKEDSDLEILQIYLSQLCDKFERLDATQRSISELLMEEKEFEKDFETSETYRDNVLALKSKSEIE